MILGADPNDEDPAGMPALFAAIDRTAPDREEVLAMLLAANADVGQRGVNDYTPLHYAACHDDVASIELLLTHGADPIAKTRIDHYATPAEEAEYHGHAIGAAAIRRWSRTHASTLGEPAP